MLHNQRLPNERRDMNLSERFNKVGPIFIQNGDFDVTVGKIDAKTLERDRSDVTVGTKNRKKRAFNILNNARLRRSLYEPW